MVLWDASHVVEKDHHLDEAVAPLNVVVHIALRRRPLGLFHFCVRKSEPWGEDANQQKSDERNAIRNPSAARLCQWLERAKASRERSFF